MNNKLICGLFSILITSQCFAQPSIGQTCSKDELQLNDQSKISQVTGSLVAPACLNLWEKERTFLEFESQVRDLPWVVYSTSDNIKFHRDISSLKKKRSKSVSRNCKLPPYIVKGSYSNGDNTALYLGKAEQLRQANMIKTEPCGWVNIDDIITRVQPIKTSSAIFKKAVILFDWRTLENNDVSKIKNHSNLYEKPSRKSKTSGKLPSKDIAYIYKEKKVNNQKWYFIITDSYLTERRYGKARKGWIPASSVQNWHTSEAIYPNERRGSTKAVIYKDEAGARDQNEDKIVAYDPGTYETRPGTNKNGEIERPYLVLPIENLFSCPECYLVAYIGAAYYDNQIITRSDKSLDSTIGSISTASETLVKAASTLNLIFLIDATASFDNFLSATKSTIKSLRYDVNRLLNQGVDINFKAVVYRDKYAGRKIVETISAKSFSEMNELLKPIKTTVGDKGDKDREEALDCAFNGLYSVLNKSNDDFKSVTNLVIAFGDNGNTSKNPCGGTSSAISQFGDFASIGIRVFGMSHRKGQPKKFNAVLKRMYEEINGSVGYYYSEHSKDSESDIANALQNWIKPILNKMVCSRKKAMDIQSGVGDNDFPCKENSSSSQGGEQEDVKSFNLEKVHKEITLRRMMNTGLSRQKAEKLWSKMRQSHASIPLPGFIKPSSAFNNMILFSKDELSEYIGAISDVVNQGDRISILKAMKLTCQNLARAENVTGSSCSLMRDAIVDVDAYELLKRSPEDILKSLRDPRFYDTVQQKAIKSLRKLDRLITQKENFFPIGQAQYIWLRQDEML